ncbi:hypothetical protein SS05631_c14640 [Sinorhizobium sp. CCBAU 05631]|uniref:Uncharacterized protein n=1 Tax=Sinorhizobium americanum TaxID=194963 RepID=A0A1L3LLX8_9HYPH|nr:hypothetical protein SAMCCGM7_Ch1730 [Sinorhizobium americanum CCGM7]APG91033.1 hypothetical protein SAMCFNEI73_Ch1740 [Sinorhizobium americanum]ASY56401.1 hypothetical protein SS05631_c14640 [Sinorhizobium sp. CCBAU 05631]
MLPDDTHNPAHIALRVPSHASRACQLKCGDPVANVAALVAKLSRETIRCDFTFSFND